MSIQKHPFEQAFICHSCGYNMVGRTKADPCPECGTLLDTRRNDSFAHGRSLIVQASLVVGILLMPLKMGFGVIFMVGGLSANHGLRKDRPQYRVPKSTSNRIKRIKLFIWIILIEFLTILTLDSSMPAVLFWW